MQASEIEFCRRLAKAIAQQFGSNCGVVVHNLQTNDPERSIAAIENGHVFAQFPAAPDNLCPAPQTPEDRSAFLTKTEDGRLLKSSTVYLQDSGGRATGSFTIHYDITQLAAMRDALQELVPEESSRTPGKGGWNVSALLEELLEESVRIAGKPVEQMNKEDKVKAIRFLNDSGAFLISKSGPRVCGYFGISKYTLYSYLDEAKTENA